MKNWILKLRIRLKLLIAFGSILLMSVLLIVVGLSSIRKIIGYNELAERIDGINISTLNMSRNIQQFAEKGFKKEEFLKNGESPLITAYYNAYKQIDKQLDTLGNHPFLHKEKTKVQYATLKHTLKTYEKQVSTLLEIYGERGFQDYGVEGKLRDAIHAVEDADYPYNKVAMLMLRRHEKDFFLRKNLKYLKQFNSTIDEFKTQLNVADSTNSVVKQQLLSLIDVYKKEFNHIVDLEQKIGLDSQKGILGKMNEAYTGIENALNQLTTQIKTEKDQIVRQSMVTLFILLVIQITIGFVLVAVYANMLTKSIKEIKSALVGLSQGSFPPRLVTRTKDEIAETKIALNNLVERIRAAVKFATDLGKGNLKIAYDDRYKDDVLAQAIIKMKDQLIEADEQQAIINWSNEGMAKFSEILKNESENLRKLGNDIIGQMVKYLDVNQGVLYILDSDQQKLERIATYAYQKKKFVDQIVKVGQGLVGQCVLEGSYIHLKDVPSDYINITSGLGKATASHVLIMPLKIREEVMGVIELASFKPFSDEAIVFIEKASENIANILSNKKTAEHMKELLEEAQQKAEEMKAQEEEMRQNSEELHATQEEMERQRKEMEEYISKLEKRLKKEEEAPKSLVQEKKETSLAN